MQFVVKDPNSRVEMKVLSCQAAGPEGFDLFESEPMPRNGEEAVDYIFNSTFRLKLSCGKQNGNVLFNNSPTSKASKPPGELQNTLSRF